MKPKVFTLSEANQLLSQLSPVLSRLREKKLHMLSLHEQILTAELIQEKDEKFYESQEGMEYLEQSYRLEALIVSFEQDLQEVAALGCVLRDIEKGIIDFYHVCRRDLVFLNWTLGEEEVAYWHTLNASFLERLPLDQLVEE